ncbi:MAG: TM0106 family RecB-like putative nuclease, partial [Nitrospirota bacterium]|nr:TM0106 family RecB-like putative nuclease [Nitrospirota bacterium]
MDDYFPSVTISMIITSDIFAAYLKCPSKCWLRFQGEEAAGNMYSQWAGKQNQRYRNEALKRILDNLDKDDFTCAPTQPVDIKLAKWKLAVDLVARSKNLESSIHALERIPSEGRGRSAQVIPIRFTFFNKLTRDDKLLLAFDALILSEMLGLVVSLGRIIHGDNYSTLQVKTSAQTRELHKLIRKIDEVFSSPSPPDLVLKRHCGECEFQSQCRQRAIEKNDLSLLAGMTEKELRKFNSKGIFTVTQLSYTFRPRRRSKRLATKPEKYHHSLKALAIREQKIHIVGNPQLRIEGTPIFFDVEGLPDRDSYYLIGIRFKTSDGIIQHSLWADRTEEEKIWTEFLSVLSGIENPVLIHYGSFETTFLKKMCNRYGGPPEDSALSKAIATSVNLLSVIYSQVYFPSYSNGL